MNELREYKRKKKKRRLTSRAAGIAAAFFTVSAAGLFCVLLHSWLQVEQAGSGSVSTVQSSKTGTSVNGEGWAETLNPGAEGEPAGQAAEDPVTGETPVNPVFREEAYSPSVRPEGDPEGGNGPEGSRDLLQIIPEEGTWIVVTEVEPEPASVPEETVTPDESLSGDGAEESAGTQETSEEENRETGLTEEPEGLTGTEAEPEGLTGMETEPETSAESETADEASASETEEPEEPLQGTGSHEPESTAEEEEPVESSAENTIPEEEPSSEESESITALPEAGDRGEEEGSAAEVHSGKENSSANEYKEKADPSLEENGSVTDSSPKETGTEKTDTEEEFSTEERDTVAESPKKENETEAESPEAENETEAESPAEENETEEQSPVVAVNITPERSLPASEGEKPNPAEETRQEETAALSPEEQADLALRMQCISSYGNLGIVSGVNHYLNMRSGPSMESEVCGVIFGNCAVDILGTAEGDWLRIRSGDAVGYVSGAYILSGEEARKIALRTCRYEARVNAETLPVYYAADAGSGVITTVRRGDRFVINGYGGNDWIRIEAVEGLNGYVRSDSVSAAYYLEEGIAFGFDPSVSQLRRNIINTAFQYLGGRYVWGGESLETGVDCSAYVMNIYRMNGINIGARRSYEQALKGVPVSENDIRPGDLIFYVGRIEGQIGHVAIYIGNGKIIHAASESKGICVSSWKFVPIVCIRNVIPD